MSSSSGRSTVIVDDRTRLVSEVGFRVYVTSALPAVPPSTKLSKLDVLLMANAYIAHLGRLVQEDRHNDEQQADLPTSHSIHNQGQTNVTFHPVKKWPMRARLYAGLNFSGSHRPSDQTKVCPSSSFRG